MAMVSTHPLDVAVQFGITTFFLSSAGWYVVWQLFLSKFKFLRELIGDTGSQQGDNEPSETETEQETPPSHQRGRQKSARQRRAPTEDTT
ncbi:small integral membrane protein 13 [Cyanistes caeruleus]|uniref:small integral membrane protein 13 n=1 Tax=Cyanistes caeruleus TaxID=156563 RepID=UPI000CDAD443|nr:small integral membrane protein 13 [Cyanistes caeruleus]